MLINCKCLKPAVASLRVTGINMGRDTLNLGLFKNNANLGLIWEGTLKSGLFLTINPK